MANSDDVNLILERLGPASDREGTPAERDAALQRFEAAHGPLPADLRAFVVSLALPDIERNVFGLPCQLAPRLPCIGEVLRQRQGEALRRTPGVFLEADARLRVRGAAVRPLCLDDSPQGRFLHLPAGRDGAGVWTSRSEV